MKGGKNSIFPESKPSLGQLALEQRMWVYGFLLILIAWGVYALSRLNIESYPDVADTEVTVITKFPGRAAEEVESLVTKRLERELNNIPGLIKRRSQTIPGLSVIRLTFADGTDDYFARSRVLEKLKDANLPEGAGKPELGPLTSPVGEIYRYILRSDTGLSPMELRTLQDWTVIPQLLRTEGIADITTVGGEVKEYQVIVNPDQLRKYDLGLADLQNAIENNNANTGGNSIFRGTQEIPVRAIGAAQDETDIRNIIVGVRKGVPIFIKDVAQVRVGHPPYKGIFGYYDGATGENIPHAVEGIVLMLRGQNPGNVLRRLKERVSSLNEQLKPLGAELVPVLDRSELTELTLYTVSKTMLEGMTVVLLVITLFLGNLRAALVTAAIIPLSLLFAFILMDLTGIPANLLSLGAIDFGIVIDGAVVSVERILRNYHSHPGEEPLLKIKRAVSGIEKQIIFSILIIIAAYLPIFLFQRIEGKLFSPMAFTIAFALIGALVLAVIAVPVLALRFFPANMREWQNPIVIRFGKIYASTLERILQVPQRIIAGAFTLVTVVFLSGLLLGVEFLPELDEGAINLRVVMPAGTSITESARIADLVRKTLSAFPEVRAVLSAAGRNDDGTDPYGANRIEFTIPLRKYSEWSSGRANKHELIREISATLRPLLPGAKLSFSQPILDNVSEAVTGSVADLAIILKGEDLVALRKSANEILEVVKDIRGLSESGIEQEGPQTQLTITMDRVQAALHGVNFSDIQNMTEMAIGGKTVSSLIQNGKSFDISIRYPLARRAQVTDIGRLMVKTAASGAVPLSQVARIELVEGPSKITRLDGSRMVSVWMNIAGRDQGSFVAEAMRKVEARVHLPQGTEVIWGGQFENLKRAGRRLMLAIPLTLCIIFLILYRMFRNAREVLLVFANVPFALVGGILALHSRGMNFNISAGVGFISLFGVAVMSGVLFVYACSQAQKAGNIRTSEALRELVLRVCSAELQPALLMMVVAMLGLVPAMLATGIGSDIQRPMATVIVGGLASATVLSIFVLPALYYTTGRRKLLSRGRSDEKYSLYK
jgi:cobalt-zinc-cadmium resistance protein CzcA